MATPSALGPMAAGTVAVALFAWRALRVPNPLIDLRLFRQRGFATGPAVNLVLGVALFGLALPHRSVATGRRPPWHPAALPHQEA